MPRVPVGIICRKASAPQYGGDELMPQGVAPGVAGDGAVFYGGRRQRREVVLIEDEDWVNVLANVVKPPADVDPVWCVPGEGDLTDYPEDYLRLVRTYGPGSIDNFVNVLSPVHPKSFMSSVTWTAARVAALDEAIGDGNFHFPPELHDPSRLHIWATSTNGDMFYWASDKNGNPIDLVAVNPDRDDEWSIHRMSVSEFHVRMLRREESVSVFPDDFPQQVHRLDSSSGDDSAMEPVVEGTSDAGIGDRYEFAKHPFYRLRPFGA